MKLRVIAGIISIIALFIFWQITSISTGSSLILPSPLEVGIDILLLVKDKSFLSMICATFLRGTMAFCIACFLSIILGISSGLSATFSSVLKPWMSIIKSTPVVSFILIAIFIFGSSFVPVFVSILMTLPVMTEAIAAGVRNTDKKLLEMTHVFQFSFTKTIWNIQVPSALPFFISGAGTSLGLCWKVVVAGEILAFPRYGIGTAMQTAKIHLETPRVFSLTLVAILLSVFTDFIFEHLSKISKRHHETGITHS